LKRLRSLVHRFARGTRAADLRARSLRTDAATWTASRLGSSSVPRRPEGDWSARIEARAAATQNLGEQPLWSKYAAVGDPGAPRRSGSRTSDDVRTSREMGRFFSWLVTDRRPSVVVEFGSAFGVSGMYWLSGLESNGEGRLLTFEPNETWAAIARGNLAAIGTRFDLTVGTFEDKVDGTLSPGERIDIAFIDAIHTSEFVGPQFELVTARLSPGGLVLLDDIDFSPDMRSCWEKIRADRRLAASVEVDRVGIVEFRQ